MSVPFSWEGRRLTSDINYAGGWANARGATEAVVARARALGVKFVGGTASSLIKDGSRVVGVETDRGPLHADVVILAMGSWTPTLLPELSSTCLPTGQVVGVIELTDSEAHRYRNAPVTRLIDNGFYVFPPCKCDSGWVMKFAIHQKGFLNPQPGFPSLPRTQLTRGYEFQQVPAAAKVQLKRGLERVYPELAQREWKASRLCWYSDRPTGDFLLDWHPELEGLFVAAGCCGHAFKFLPIMGRLISDAMEGRLEPELKEIWSWNGKEGRRDESRDFSQYHRLDQESRL